MSEFRPTRWWRAISPEGQLWCESSIEREVRDAMRPQDRLQRLYEKKEFEWRDEETHYVG